MAAGDPGSPARYYSSTAVETALGSSIPAQSQGQANTSFIVGSISGFPTDYPYTLIVDPDTSKEEVVTVTAGSGTTLTVTRGSDNTQAVAHSAGSVVRHGVSGREFRESENHIAARGYDIDQTILDAADQTHVHGIATGDGVIVGTLKTQTLTNKTLTSPVITNPSISGAGVDASIVFEGATADAYETTLTVIDPTQDNTITLPNTTGTIVLDTATQTLTNKTLTSPTISGSPVITGLSSAGMIASSAAPKDYVDSILGSATAASTSAASAATSAASAATSATSAANSATASATSASASATSATAAATSATSAAASATAAATSATSAAASAVTAANSVATIAGYATTASNSASAAATSATSASASATAAATSATSAAASATAAATSATSASASATAAATSATNAATSATSAAASATAAAGYVVPSQTGNNGKFLQTNGSVVSWQNPAGDIESITASSPLTGGGTSGAITVGIQAATTAQSGAVQLTDSTASTSVTTAATPNSVKSSYDLANAAIPKSLIDVKGDLVTATANDTPARLAVGANGETLVADSSATTGLRYQGSVAAGKNAVINGGMDIWQRGASGLGTSTGSYTADRWVLGSSSTTVTRDTDVPTSPYFQYSLKMVGTAENSIITKLESATSTLLAGQTVTFSFYAKRTAGTGNLDVRFYYPSATDNFASVTQIGSTSVVAASPSASWTRYSVTAAIGTNITTGLQILINNDAASGSTTFITGVQLELGSVATQFSRAGGTLAGELAACQRYYNNVGTVGHVAYSAVGVMGFVFPVTMRTTPTASFSYSGVANRFYNIQTGATSDLVSPTVIVSNTGVQNLYAFTPTNWAVAAGTGFHTQWTLSAEL